MDKIILKGLEFYGYHGVLPEEQVIGQKFIIDVEIYTDLHEAGLTDKVEKTVNYAEVYQILKLIVEKRKYQLLEALAENCAKEILKSYPQIKEVLITVYKPQAPVAGIYDYFGVEIRRKQNE
ncbi:MAG TPA: dihydroneopterin aldolase [Haloplasmataceae bacterium]|jgi:dihydroneopterin aldolase